MLKNTFLIITLFSSLILAQKSTFHQMYQENKHGTMVLETNNSNFIVSGYSGEDINDLAITKIDPSGKPMWTRNIRNDINPISNYPILVNSNNNIVVVSTMDHNNQYDILLSEIDPNGTILDQKTFGDESISEIPSAIQQSPNGDYSILFLNNDGSGNYLGMIKIDQNGSMVLNKTTSQKHSAFSYPQFIELEDSNLFVFGSGPIRKYDAQFDLIFEGSARYSWMVKSSDNNLLGLRNRKITKMDLDGNILWEKQTDNVVTKIVASTEDQIIVLTSNSLLIKYNNEGTIEWFLNSRIGGKYLSQSNDGDLFIVGSEKEYGGITYLSKISQEGKFNYLCLTKPIPGESLSIFYEYDIKWIASYDGILKIDYSYDNGLNWNLISSSEPIINNEQNVGGTYSWIAPNNQSENVLIKISDINDHNIFDISSKPFQLSYYQSSDFIAANNCKMWITNDGQGSHNPQNEEAGFLWPGGENATTPISYNDGLVFGGRIDKVLSNGWPDTSIYVNGNTQRGGLVPGIILPDGSNDNPHNPDYKIFKIKRDWESLADGPTKEKYKFNYNNWPVHLGAPYNDINGNGSYDKNIDEPKFLGDEVLFYVANGNDSLKSDYVYGSPPLPMEYQTTIWAFDKNNELADVIFKKYKIINKGTEELSGVYFSYWVDDDLGYNNDDVVGCDTSLNMGYTYNGDDYDENVFGNTPPSVGRQLLQGPITRGYDSDTAFVNGEMLPGFKNLPMTSFVVYLNSNASYVDPDQGVYEGSLQMYNNMKGRIWNGEPYLNPITEDETKFVLSGDPVAKTGWYENQGWPGGPSPDDRRYLMSTGPFNMMPGDSQEVVYSIIVARGKDNINSVAELKRKAHVVREYYYGNDITDVNEELISTPTKFELKQNYPNPFNPTTIIEYSIPSPTVGTFNETAVQLFVYDILGREVATLVNENQKPGSYKVEFDASKFASGIYIYQLKAGTNITSKKMVLMK